MALLSSPRRRRRLAWGLAIGGVGAGIAVLGVVWPNTGTSQQLAQHAGTKRIYVTSRTVPFEGARGDDVLRLEQQFVERAVYRHDVAGAYDLVAPELRRGYTRARWATSDIPVEPYPAAAVKEVRGRLLYSYAERASLQITFVPKAGAGISQQTFDLMLHRIGPATARRWVVGSWLPSSFGAGPRAAGRANGIDLRPAGKGQLGAVWLAVPAGVLGLLLLALIGLGARSWQRQRRAARAYLLSRSGP